MFEAHGSFLNASSQQAEGRSSVPLISRSCDGSQPVKCVFAVWSPRAAGAVYWNRGQAVVQR